MGMGRNGNGNDSMGVGREWEQESFPHTSNLQPFTRPFNKLQRLVLYGSRFEFILIDSFDKSKLRFSVIHTYIHNSFIKGLTNAT